MGVGAVCSRGVNGLGLGFGTFPTIFALRLGCQFVLAFFSFLIFAIMRDDYIEEETIGEATVTQPNGD